MRLKGVPALLRDRLIRAAGLIPLVPFAVLVASCGGGGGSTAAPPPPPPPVTYTATGGVAQKGPLIQGSTVTAQELDSKLSPTGKQYSYQINSNLGTFSPTSTFSSQYIGLNATGYYFDEVANAVSAGTVTLVGYSDLTVTQALNVNLLTTLAYQRIQHLVTSSGMTFAAARTQAENEVLSALNIPAGSYGSFGTLNLAGGTDGDHMLAAVSSIFVFGNSAGSLSQLIAGFQTDVATNGVITNAATRSALVSASKSLNPATVAANLTQAYSSAGVTFSAANIADWIDQDGDGVIGRFKFQVADATPSSVFTFPASVVSLVAGTSVSVTGGMLSVNQTPVTGAVTVHAGDVMAVSPGAGAFPNGVLTVYLVSGTTNTARVSFVDALLSIAVTPASPSIARGLTQQFKATGTFSDTSTADLTNSVTWSSATASVATVGANSGLANTLTIGSTVVTATSGSTSGSTTLTVAPAVVESISITPNPAFSGIGIQRQITATGTYSDGTTANVTSSANWTSDTPSVATVGPTTGLATGASLGSTTITAAIGSVTASLSLAIVANTWSPAASLPIGRANQTATLLQNGKVVVAGGTVPTTTTAIQTATAELYDPVADTWSSAGSLSSDRGGTTATLLPSGKVLVASGACFSLNGLCFTGDSDLYDPATNTWSAAASVLTPRASHTATLLTNGKVLVAGGQAGRDINIAPTASCEIYDPATNTWSPAASLLVSRMSHTATMLPSGKVLVAGGYAGTGSVASATAELYDPVTNTWTAAASMPIAVGSASSVLLPNGKVLMIGGDASVNVTGSTAIYDPATDTWSAGASMQLAVVGFSATLLPNGKVLVAGGRDVYNNLVATSELYDPAADTWSATGTLLTAISGHTATLLSNGVVLVVGGLTTSSYTTIVQLYW